MQAAETRSRCGSPRSRWQTALSVALGVCGLLLLAPIAMATVVRALSVEEMARQATFVVHASVLSTRAVEREGRFETDVTLAVAECLKGPCASAGSLVATLPGGQVGDLAQTVSGTPHLQNGDEVVLFLWADAAGRSIRVLGLSQGAFHVRRRAGQVMAVSDRTGLERPTSAAPAGTEAAPRELPIAELPLVELLARVRSALLPPADSSLLAPVTSPGTPSEIPVQE